jgi:hypothetical protein
MRIVAITILIAAALLWVNAPPIVAQDNTEISVKMKCTYCHNAERICKSMGRKNASEWRATITRMVTKGAKIDDTQKNAMADFLVAARPQSTTLCGN